MDNIFSSEESSKQQNQTSSNIRTKIGILTVIITIIVVCVIIVFSSSQSSLPDQQKQSTNNSVQYPTQQVSPTVALVPGKDFVIGRVMVKFKKDVSQLVIDEKLRAYDAKIIDNISQLNVSVVQVPSGKEKEIADQLVRDNIVEYAEHDLIYHRDWTPNDPSLGKEYHIKMIKADQAWDITKGGGVKVAVVADHVDENHPDLAGQFAGVRERNASDQDHGTNVAGTIAAVANNAIGIAGVCPECKLLLAGGSGSGSSTAEAITWAVDQGAKVITMSFHTSSNSNTMQAAIDYAWSKGANCFGSTGNDGALLRNPVYPAGSNHCIGVSSTDSSDSRSSFGNYGPWVKMTAPGSSILTTNDGGGYGTASGTSFSTPITAAVAALIWSTSYGTSPDAVAQRLCDTADKIEGTGTEWQCGRVNAFAAVQGAGGINNSPPSPMVTTQITQPISFIPSQVCLGSCPTPTPIKSATPLPTQPGGGIVIPTGNGQIQISLQPINGGNPGGGGNGQLRSLLEFIINLILTLIMFMFKLLIFR